MAKVTLSKSLHNNLKELSEQFNGSSNLKIRNLNVGDTIKREAAIIYMDGITNTQNIQDNILAPLLKMSRMDSIESVIKDHLSIMDVKAEALIDEIVLGLTKGKCFVIIDGYNQGILADAANWQKRSLSEPDTQRTIKGRMIGFNEQLKVNLNLLQNMIQTQKLKIESYQIGNEAKTDVALLFIDEYVDKKVLEEVKKKLQEVDIKYLLEARVIEDALEEKKTLFPLVFTSERPDVTVSALFEGRVVIIVNGLPFVLIVPCLFIHYFQQPDEYNSKAGRFGSRIFRLFSWLLALLLPAIYIAITRFHTGWFPSPFDKKLLTSETLLPFIWEVLILLFIFHSLLEATIRIPKNTTLLITLIGTTVIGETAVYAKIIHPLSLIIVGINFLTSIHIASGGLWGSLVLLRLVFVMIGYFFGLTGILIGLLLLILYMASLKSIGVPYLSPFIPFNAREMKDAIYRGDLRRLINSKHTYPHKENNKK
ncbi:spore germination protein [Bacillus xiapuensis]|uniref:Spore germination protein n=1 Tax=Bacillus xiapuensis TaxID=2014075 RepID=A0ABU6N4N5_9BACI|nr:spore germination protein [Bacillus xiapuensis]